jgi:hypothetical protein|tara:strand:+ start:489 stop:647 length:159 start_codon:yes stop_codon:yes gene_type:complete
MTINGIKMNEDTIMSLVIDKKDKDALVKLLPYEVELKDVIKSFLEYKKQEKS